MKTGRFHFCIFGIEFRRRIAAHGTAVQEHFIGAGKTTHGTADRGEITRAIWTDFYITAYFITAIVTKKAWFLFQYYADLVSGCSTEATGHFPVSPAGHCAQGSAVEDVFLFSDLVLSDLFLSVT